MKVNFFKIIALIYTLLFISVSNGFIIEEYFCSGCRHEHQDLKFFEFGEISHNHYSCYACSEAGVKCNCHPDDHLNNTKITYFSLKELFFSLSKKIDNPVILDLISKYVLHSTSIIYDITVKDCNQILKIPLSIGELFKYQLFNPFFCLFLL